MKKISLILALAVCVIAPLAFATADKPAAPDAAWLAKATAEYPLNTCVVSGEEFGSMGKAIDYVYKQEGKPDRLVRFCCKDCRKDFDKEPAQYLKKIDEAAAKAKKG